MPRRIAAGYPHIQFSVSQGEVGGANVSSFEVLLEQPAFLAGMLAGWSSRNGVVGHLSGERVRAGLKGRAAFAAGLHRTAPAARLLSTFCGSQHDAGLAARCVRAQADAGADIVFTMLGAGRTGAIDACREAGIRQVGDGIDWCALEPDVFLASAIADSGWGSLRAIELLVNDRLNGGARETTGLENPAACRLATAPGLGADMRALIESAAEDIVMARVSVPTAWEGVEFDANSGHPAAKPD